MISKDWQSTRPRFLIQNNSMVKLLIANKLQEEAQRFPTVG